MGISVSDLAGKFLQRSSWAVALAISVADFLGRDAAERRDCRGGLHALSEQGRLLGIIRLAVQRDVVLSEAL